ncbi:MAG TPA: HAMP domain-containing histidine kinase [Candidatus Oscillibacter excrementavium]|nr:HAMP domain-containing histidine kinase [Candidatus Oscillibacter excrementavium]
MKAMKPHIEEEIAQAVAEEIAPPAPKTPRRKTKLTERTIAKVMAFLLLVVMTAVTAGGILGAAFLYQADVYSTSETAFKQELFSNIAWGDGRTLLDYLERNDNSQTYQIKGEAARRYCLERNIALVEIQDKSGKELWRSSDLNAEGFRWQFTFNYDWADPYKPSAGAIENAYTVKVVLSSQFNMNDAYALANWAADLAYALRYWVYAIIAAAALMVLACFVFLLCAAGHHPGTDGVRPGWGTKLPLDLLTAAVALVLFLGIEMVVEANFGGIGVVLVVVLGPAVLAGIFTGWCMSFALRLKLGSWWRNTVIYIALRWAWKVVKKLGGGLGNLGRGLTDLLGGIPLVGKTVLIFLGLCVLEGLGILVSLGFFWSWGLLAFLWVVEKILLFLAVLAVALMCRKLLLGGRALAAGDLSYQVDTSRMVLDFKSHGEDLNHIAQGMAAAVEERMRSERMKTELITNVSHDIKTPLTSIINYADLIGQEPKDSDKIPEYAAVLTRQSERLKRLIEDLVEASKASTGNLEVNLAPCQPGVLLTQAAGEYEQKLKDAGLDLVTRQPETAVTILADGRRLWRVFDNLMNNICKYAQRGTRVYLTLEERDGQAVISFKNTSRAPLDIPAEELLERFVRGDAARTGEGNGLGLSIAKSLTELQQGTLDLTVDGDLFKVVLKFRTVS